MQKLSYEEWVKRFKPIRNDLNPQGSYNGYMFETFGKELDAVVKYLNDNKRFQIWTLIAEDDHLWIANSYHFVNRVGYFITEVPYEDSGETIEVILSEPRYGVEIVDQANTSFQVIDRETKTEVCIVNSYKGESQPAEERAELIRSALEAYDC
jgi:hypothetical protein